MRAISKGFPGVQALENVDFEIHAGKAHALVGANGAGKSTLMKVLCGAYHDYDGVIELDEQEITIRSPRDAKALGIEVVQQEVDTSLVPALSVAENILVSHFAAAPQRGPGAPAGAGAVRGGSESAAGERATDGGGRLPAARFMKPAGTFVRWRSLFAEARAILEWLGINIDPKAAAASCTLAEKQMIVIARAIATQCNFLVLDEPTAPLSEGETQTLFRVIRELLATGIGVVFISHRLSELTGICSSVTVLRDGRHVATKPMAETSIEEMIDMMLGRKMEETFPSRSVEPGKPVLQVEGLSDRDKIRDIDLTVRAGEIVGVAGLVGAGKSELCKAVYGASVTQFRRMELCGRPYHPREPYHAVERGIGLVPEERRKEGILVEEGVAVNLTSASLRRFSSSVGTLKFRSERTASRAMIQDLGIMTPSESQKTMYLSGGNQQKVAIGKWLISDAELYIFDEPTKGIDVNAKHEMFELISALAARGKAVIYASAELEEIMGMCDRVYVMYDGRIVRELNITETSENELLTLSTGGS
jgi:simple sugar transport system ATP-binding protein